jgi:hypothetical protein
MHQSVVLHMVDQEIIMGDVETLPIPSDQFIIIHNPLLPDGRRLSYLEDGVRTILVPWHQILFVQLLPGDGSDMPVGFVRE